MSNAEIIRNQPINRTPELFALQLYRRIRADLRRPLRHRAMDAKLKSWRDLLREARQEGLLTRSESAAILKWARQKEHLFGHTSLPRWKQKAAPSWKSAALL